MHTRMWLSQDHQFVPGAVLFQSPRTFSAWAYSLATASCYCGPELHPCPKAADGTGSTSLFKPVEAMKTRMEYENGIDIRCASLDEPERIITETRPPLNDKPRVVMVEGGGIIDYVVTGAVGC